MTQRLRQSFLALPEAKRKALLQQTIDEAAEEFTRNLIRRRGCDEDVSYDVLQLFARSVASTS